VNLTARRIATAAAASTLTICAFAATGPAAHAAKPSKAPLPLWIEVMDSTTAPEEFGPTEFRVNYQAPAVAATAVRSVTCTLDAAPMDNCGDMWDFGDASYSAEYYTESFAAGPHTITYTVTTKRATYTGSVQFTGTGA
jgi:hypothetical protein